MDGLISRKALKQAIDHDFYEHYTKYHDTDQIALIDMVMDDIDEMPVAFDKEKVIEELKGRTSFLQDCTKYGNKDEKQMAQSYSTMMLYEVAQLVDDLIEIVEKGGIE